MLRVERRLRRKGGLREGLIERAGEVDATRGWCRARADDSVPASLLALAAVYLGAIEAAFSALMRLSLRLVAERSRPSGRAGRLSRRSASALHAGAAAARLVTGVGDGAASARDRSRRQRSIVLVAAQRDGLRDRLRAAGAGRHRRPRSRAVLEWLLPSFAPIRGCSRSAAARVDGALGGARSEARADAGARSTPDEAAMEANEVAKAYIDSAGAGRASSKAKSGRLLQSIVDFGDTLVREVMTPRPDIVAIRMHATIGDLRALFQRAGVFAVSGLQGQRSTTSPASSSSRTWSCSTTSRRCAPDRAA